MKPSYLLALLLMGTTVLLCSACWKDPEPRPVAEKSPRQFYILQTKTGLMEEPSEGAPEIRSLSLDEVVFSDERPGLYLSVFDFITRQTGYVKTAALMPINKLSLPDWPTATPMNECGFAPACIEHGDTKIFLGTSQDYTETRRQDYASSVLLRSNIDDGWMERAEYFITPEGHLDIFYSVNRGGYIASSFLRYDLNRRKELCHRRTSFFNIGFLFEGESDYFVFSYAMVSRFDPDSCDSVWAENLAERGYGNILPFKSHVALRNKKFYLATQVCENCADGPSQLLVLDAGTGKIIADHQVE